MISCLKCKKLDISYINRCNGDLANQAVAGPNVCMCCCQFKAIQAVTSAGLVETC